ncbi:MAG TPA: pyridoxamine 5'-phosphate oxidase family protein [Dehalococcoidia bacterium]|nr:pyridoxamine 5'-phosphate oxidase family protein [Dehalococcoidia bacterium]
MRQPQEPRAPKAERPYMREYGVSREAEGLLPWRWAEDRLRRNRNYWLATVRPDGRPHLMPVWGVWLDGSFFFSTAASSRKAKNLRSDPRCALSVENGLEPIVVEGTARPVEDAATLERAADAYSRKYDWPLRVRNGGVYDSGGNGGPLFRLEPETCFGMTESDLARTATRWRF